eukprot:20410_1
MVSIQNVLCLILLTSSAASEQRRLLAYKKTTVPFDEWTNTDIDDWKRENDAQLQDREAPFVIDIDGNEHYYVRPQHRHPMQHAVWQHWITHPLKSGHTPDHPLNQDYKRPSIFINGRVTNPYTAWKEKHTLRYWTDDGVGDHDNLWTVAMNDGLLDHHKNGNLHWAMMYSLQGPMKRRYGFIVIFESLHGPIELKLAEFAGTGHYLPVRNSADVFGRIQFKDAWGDSAAHVPDSCVFSPEAQNKHPLIP